MLDVFFDVILPVALIAAAGGLVGGWRGVPVAPISALTFYLFSPALVFNSLSNTALPAGVSLRIVGVGLTVYVASYVLATLWSTVARHDRALRAGFALAATTQNGGNMGLPVALLAFGDAGLDVAIVNFVLGAGLAASAGVFIASSSTGSHGAALTAPFRYPLVYAALAGIAVNGLNITLPVTLDAPIASLAGAAVPAMLIVLGLQLRQSVGLDHAVDTGGAVVLRLLVAPGVAYLATLAFGLEGVTQHTMVVLAAMPTAVIATILATEFAARPAFVTRAVVVSSLASMLTLTVLISLVR